MYNRTLDDAATEAILLRSSTASSAGDQREAVDQLLFGTVLFPLNKMLQDALAHHRKKLEEVGSSSHSPAHEAEIVDEFAVGLHSGRMRAFAPSEARIDVHVWHHSAPRPRVVLQWLWIVGIAFIVAVLALVQGGPHAWPSVAAHKPAIMLLGPRPAPVKTAEEHRTATWSLPGTERLSVRPVIGKQLLAFGETMQGGGRSRGAVFEAAPGARVSSPVSGAVARIGRLGKHGRLVVIEAGAGYRIMLAGLGRVDVRKDQLVHIGSRLGSVADLKEGDKAVLYVELRKGDQSIDPATWFAWEDQDVPVALDMHTGTPLRVADADYGATSLISRVTIPFGRADGTVKTPWSDLEAPSAPGPTLGLTCGRVGALCSLAPVMFGTSAVPRLANEENKVRGATSRASLGAHDVDPAAAQANASASFGVLSAALPEGSLHIDGTVVDLTDKAIVGSDRNLAAQVSARPRTAPQTTSAVSTPFKTASAAGAAKPLVEAAPPPAVGHKCRVWTASYGGQKALIIRSVIDKVVNYTVLDVNEGAEKRKADAFISAYAKGGAIAGEYGSKAQALDKAFEFCPEG